MAAAGVTEEQIVAELDAVGSRDPQNWGWVLAARVLSRIPGLDARVIDTWLRDVSLYVTDEAVRRAVHQVVEAELGDEPFVAVGHSLGSVVAYNVLRSAHRRGPCRGLITLGSPRGIPSIRGRLTAPVNYPHRLAAWLNAFDQADIVALRPLDTEFFPTDPLIENHGGVANFTDNRHGIEGYLADGVVAKRIADLLRA
ncbi:alpha/beta fold hydrolase [Nocardia puris]|uniref:alpha/beta fold hydrolase n=1 Tax=Nocardia puris TaxID=208602 RepID=UPI001896258A|nr:alpha/beta fold hydrolase [Nocardia puris]MBF6212303.1 alpha/beta fold hydrolase [Nocardia puris]MBF6366550.1 alpha/beta fold hydrolase [Nocardia puris]MBF6460892.1 alpha/beta fold hydrolase [Nocardia puris]